MSNDPRTTGWRPLSAPPPEPQPPPEPAQFDPPYGRIPWASAVLVACVAVGVLAQRSVGWPLFAIEVNGVFGGGALLRASVALGSLSAGPFVPSDVPGALLLHTDLIRGAAAAAGLALVAPALELLRGRVFLLLSWAAALALGWVGQQLAPYCPPGDATALLPLMMGALAGALASTPGHLFRAPGLRRAAITGVCLAAIAVAPAVPVRPWLILSSLAVGAFLGARVALPRRLDLALGVMGPSLWVLGAGMLGVRSAPSTAHIRLISDIPRDELEQTPRGASLSLGSLGLRDGADDLLARAERVEARWPATRDRAALQNNIAWVLAVAAFDEPRFADEAVRRAQRSADISGRLNVRHTLATARLARGDGASLGPEIRRLAEQLDDAEGTALLALFELERGADREALALYESRGIGAKWRGSSLLPVLVRRLEERGLLEPRAAEAPSPTRSAPPPARPRPSPPPSSAP